MTSRGAIALALLLIAGSAGAFACGFEVTGSSDGESPSTSPSSPTSSSSSGGAGEDGGTNDDGGMSSVTDPAIRDASSPPGDGDASTGCPKTAFVIADGDPQSESGAKSALSAVGFTVTTFANYGDYRGTPPASNFDIIVLLDGGQVFRAMPSTGEQAITKALSEGHGLVTEEWTGYNFAQGNVQSFSPYVLFTYASWSGSSTVTFTQSQSHPIWVGLPTTFTTKAATAFARGTGRNSPTQIATATAGAVTSAGVFVKDGPTRIAETTISVNYVNENGLNNDENVRLLFANMALWAARCR